MTDRPGDASVLPPSTCPLCHTVGPALSSGVLDIGALWTCARCGQRWNAQRIATVEAYLRFADSRLAPPAWRRSADVDTGTH
jgi:transposase